MKYEASAEEVGREIRGKGKGKGGLRRKNGGPEGVHPVVHIGIIGKSPFKIIIYAYGQNLLYVSTKGM